MWSGGGTFGQSRWVVPYNLWVYEENRTVNGMNGLRTMLNYGVYLLCSMLTWLSADVGGRQLHCYTLAVIGR